MRLIRWATTHVRVTINQVNTFRARQLYIHNIHFKLIMLRNSTARFSLRRSVSLSHKWWFFSRAVCAISCCVRRCFYARSSCVARTTYMLFELAQQKPLARRVSCLFAWLIVWLAQSAPSKGNWTVAWLVERWWEEERRQFASSTLMGLDDGGNIRE